MRTYEIYTRTREEQAAAIVEATLDVTGISSFLASAYGSVAGYLARHGMQPAGAPFARYHRVRGSTFHIEAGFPVTIAIPGEGDVRPATLPGGTIAVTMHVGPYADMEPAYEALWAWIREHDGQPVGDAWEVYFDDASMEPDPKAWRTEVFQPYRANARAGAGV